MNWFQKKRREAARSLPANSLLALSSAPAFFRQPDVPYPYRQDSNFYYLTGFSEPGGFFALFPSGRSALFIPDRDPVKELWDGPLLSPEEAKKTLFLDEVYPLSQLDQNLGRIFRGRRKIFYNRRLNPFFDRKMLPFKKNFASAEEFLAPFRRVKDEREISRLKKAVSATAWGHREIARALKPGINERALHGIFLKSLMEKGAAREGYGSIIACGNQAATLHYTKNSARCRKGELLLVDAGAEMNYYTADVTRVYPVSGSFSKPQKNLYGHLLALQKRLIREVRPGASMRALNQKMREGIGEILLEAGLLKGHVKKNLREEAVQRFCPHSLGHLLGLDVHDVGFERKKGDLVLKPRMTLTIEPGIYIPAPEKIDKKNLDKTIWSKALDKILNKKALKPLLGTGLRIEDNLLVTAKGRENLTKSIPKEIEAVEALCASSGKS